MNKPLRPNDIGYRRCLKCNLQFLSKGAGNRICKKCSRINAALGPISEAQLAAQRGVKRMNGKPIEDPASYEANVII